MVTASWNVAFCQDEVLWTQPYSGNVVYGPLGYSPRPLPNCPECDCETCQPGGCKGIMKRFWGCFRRQRREHYFCKQSYHTLYTPPVLPPYCEPGFGYYETAWRQGVNCPIGAANPVEFSHVTEPGFVAPSPTIPAPAPIANPNEASAKPSFLEELDREKKKGGSDPIRNPPAGDEKPRYEEPDPNSQAGKWLPLTPAGRSVYGNVLITPR